MFKLVWVGNRESDINFTGNLFDLSITDFGSNRGTNVAYYNGGFHKKYSRRKFIIEQLKNIELSNDYKVMFYNSSTAYSIMEEYPELSDHLVGACHKSILDVLNDKIQTRIWMSKHIATPKSMVLTKVSCTIETLNKYFKVSNDYVIQEKISSSGTGTYLMTADSEEKVKNRLKESNEYLVSEYISPSASVNTHLLISNKEVIVFPGSLQLISYRNNNFIYSGADFLAYRNIDPAYIHAIYYYSRVIGQLLKNEGFLGICGIDFIISKGNVYFVEINPRFQASTILLNLALEKAGLPSVHQLQLNIFNNIKIDKDALENIQVDFSYYKYANGLHNCAKEYNRYLDLYEEAEETYQILYDGYDRNNINENIYAFGVIMNKNISSFSDHDLMYIHPNLEVNNFASNFLPLSKLKDKMIALKIALLNQGLRITDSANIEFLKRGGYNKSVFSSIDLTINDIRFNVPINTKLSSLSPFSLSFEDDFILKYYNTNISSVKVETTKSIKNLYTKNNEPYNKIAFIGGDRLRIRPEKRCYYKAINKGCMFCPGNSISRNIYSNYDMSDIFEVIDYCYLNESFRHILIGGGTACPEDNSKRIIDTIKYISSISTKPIYLMCTPPNNKELIKAYVEAGVSEIAFNIEIYDRELAKKYMPGKGEILLEQYLESLKYAVGLLGNTGNVRSMLMVGLENFDNTLKAVEILCKNGIQPMLSIFRPTSDSSLSHIIQPSNDELLYLYDRAQKMCESFNLTLGPSCPSCQNNTLAITVF